MNKYDWNGEMTPEYARLVLTEKDTRPLNEVLRANRILKALEPPPGIKPVKPVPVFAEEKPQTMACLICGNEFAKKKTLMGEYWGVKYTCSKECETEAPHWSFSIKTKTIKPRGGERHKKCQNKKCGNEIERQPHDSLTIWEAKKYCSLKCVRPCKKRTRKAK